MYERRPKHWLAGLLGLWLVAGGANVYAQEGPGPEAADRLDQAVRYYQLGERDEARHLLAALLVDEGLSEGLRQEARVYLAELLIVDGDLDGARGFLEQVIVTDPHFVIDRFRHTPEVAGEFDYVKATQPAPVDRTPPPEPVVVTMPLSVWSPFARYHFTQGRTARGLVYLAGTTSSAVVSGMLHGILIADRRYFTDRPQELAALNQRVAAQRIATGVFYGFWGASVIDAQVHWRRTGVHAALKPAVTLDAQGIAPGLRISGQF